MARYPLAALGRRIFLWAKTARRQNIFNKIWPGAAILTLVICTCGGAAPVAPTARRCANPGFCDKALSYQQFASRFLLIDHYFFDLVILKITARIMNPIP